MPKPARWLVKTEASTYSWADLVREKTTAWTGVKNPTAQKNLRLMQKGESVLVYHTGSEKSVVGLARVARAAYPDPTARGGRNQAVDLEAVRPLARPVPLATLRQDPALKQWELLRIGRLSVMPVPDEAWRAVETLAEAAGPAAAPTASARPAGSARRR
jgi:predicted RNA-binding protein with PUA-like domain